MSYCNLQLISLDFIHALLNEHQLFELVFDFLARQTLAFHRSWQFEMNTWSPAGKPLFETKGSVRPSW